MNNKIASKGVNDGFEMSQADIAEKLFLHVNTIGTTEKRAIENFKQGLKKLGIDVKDLLED